MLDVNSNILAMNDRLKKRKQDLKDYTISLENRMPYAVAVDQGWTYRMVWAELPIRQQRAVFAAMKRRKGGGPKLEGVEGFKVEHGGEGDAAWTEITVPPAGILIKSVAPIKEYIKSVLSRMPLGEEAAQEIARGMESILVGNTPVDNGNLAGGWKVIDR